MFQHMLENFMIYAENVSHFYVLCVIVSFFAVFATWRVDKHLTVSIERRLEALQGLEEVEEKERTEDEEEKEVLSETAMSDANEENEPLDIRRYPSLEKKLLIESMSKSLDPNDREKEKEIEKQQLASILELIKKDPNKFQIGTLEELEEQMKLYRE